jgi:cytoskeleton protein RodZ
MGTLGEYLRSAREERGIELREAAQQTRISLQYLKALEEEDFSKLPGAVFVRGFLKNYGKFLKLDEAEVMKKFAESQQTLPHVAAAQASPNASQPIAEAQEKSTSSKFPLEPIIWGTIIIIVLVVALFAAYPRHHQKEMPQSTTPAGTAPALSGEPLKPEKLYLEVIALEDTWLLVRTDASPQKKAILAKGESLIWSANERFLLSYSKVGALRLLLNGKELSVDEPKNAVIRDLMITAAGITNRRVQTENVRPLKRKKQPEAASMQSEPSPTAGETAPEQKQLTKPKPAPSQAPVPAPAIPAPSTHEDQKTVPEQKPAPPAPVQVQPEPDLQSPLSQ